ncbi:MAG: neutral zinc metallopeptidase [Acidimicrobiales bacterium]
MVRYDKSAADKGSKYIDDRRSQGGRRGGGASGAGLPMGKVGGGLGGLLVLILGLIFGGDALGGGGGGTTNAGFDINVPAIDGDSSGVGTAGATGTDVPDPQADTKEFMGFLMYDIQETWMEYFADNGLQYQETTMVIFTGSVSTGCGNATSAVGPFYCPAPGDNKVYIDFDFYDELARRFGAPGDFAQAYVIAHEIGHHIQSITGYSDAVRQATQQNPNLKNELSVRQELQADCFAGVWAHSAAERTTSAGLPIIERGDINEGLAAAAAVGDDRIQEQAGMSVDPHGWTHGSAEARQQWFTVGLDTGDPAQCNTYEVDRSEVGL